MNILNAKQLANLTTPRLLEIKRKLNKIIGTRKFHITEDRERGICTDADSKFLREHEEFYATVKEMLSQREHIEPKVKAKSDHDKRSRRDGISKKRQYFVD